MKIYIGGKITGECDTLWDRRKCEQKFNLYGLKFLYPPNGDIIPYTISGFGYSSYGKEAIHHTELGKSFVHGFIINSELIDSGKGSWEQYMKNDIATMLTCDEVHFLPDWEDSKGARLERYIAEFLKMKIVDVENTSTNETIHVYQNNS